MSKYKAPWKEFDLNKDFWSEVFVGRKVVSFGPGEKAVKVGGDQTDSMFLREMLLDSGERVWLSHGVTGDDPTGKTITRLTWCKDVGIDWVGIDWIEFDDGSRLTLPDEGWRICIQEL
jgi:hypothetical protein